MNAEDEEKQSLLANTVAELKRQTAELERKSAEYDLKFARLEKITKSMQQQQNRQPQQYPSGRRGGGAGGAADMISDLSFVSAAPRDHDDNSTLFSDHPIMSHQRNTGSKKKMGAIFGYGGWIGDSDSRGGYIDHEEEGGSNNHDLSLSITIRDDKKGGEDSEHNVDAVERGIHQHEFEAPREEVISEQEPTSNNDREAELNRRSLDPMRLPGTFTRMASAFLPSSSSEDLTQSIVLDRDSFTLMMRARWCRKPWFLGTFSFLFQVSLLIFGPFNYYTNGGVVGAPFGMSYSIDVGLYEIKLLILILCVVTQIDILTSVHNIIVMRTVDDADLSKIINEDMEQILQKRRYLWITRILLPNVLKITQGILVLIVTLLVVLTSDNAVDLLKDYTALLVISQIDNIMFYIAEYGYLGSDLVKAAEGAKSVHIEQERYVTRCELAIKTLVLFSLLGSLIGSFVLFTEGQINGRYFNDTYPYCKIGVENIPNIGDGECWGGIYNTIACDFDGGDCAGFNLQYPGCIEAPEPFKVGNGVCDELYNTPECGFDGNDCCPFKTENSTDPRYDDRMCDGGFFFSEMCSLDGFDCQDYARRAPLCDYEELASLVPFGKEPRLGDRICESRVYNTPECLFENGDCDVCNRMVIDYTLTGDGTCHGGPYNTADCNYDAGDCDTFNDLWPLCTESVMNATVDKMQNFPIIGDGICNSGLYNNEDCGFEDGDCLFCNEVISNITKIGDGHCDGQDYMSEVCGYDGGDCAGCRAPSSEIGDGQCTPEYNTTECSYDGGDCVQ